MKEIKTVQAYSLVEFCQVLEQHFKDGYTIDVDDVKTCPAVYGNIYEIGFVKVEKEAKAKKTKSDKVEAPVEVKEEGSDPETATETA